MPYTHNSRKGKTYYLHIGPKRGGGTQHFFSTNPEGTLAETLPEGFETYETVNGQVYLRRRPAKLITDQERDCIALKLQKPRKGYRYKVEVRDEFLTIHEAESRSGLDEELHFLVSPERREMLDERFAYYIPMMRFVLVDTEKRFFAPERFCFKGRVNGWISIGQPGPIERLARRYLKHLGDDSLFELM